MYAVEVRDHIMIAHSFRGELFGPAQRLHGATFVVDVAFFREALTADNVVVDIGRAHDALKATLGPLNYRNLDDIPEFKDQQTTTEFLSRHVFDAMADAARSGALGPGGEGIERIRVMLHESHVARAWFEGPVAR
jgi:6-pyruvoyl-tetrahydropterin synthase